MNFCERLTGEDLLEFHQQIVLGFTSEEEVWSTMVPNDLPMDLGKDFFIDGRNSCQNFRAKSAHMRPSKFGPQLGISPNILDDIVPEMPIR